MHDLALLLGFLALTTSCATTASRHVQARPPTLAERTTSENQKDEEGLPKRPRVPRWVAPPPAYGNRVVEGPRREERRRAAAPAESEALPVQNAAPPWVVPQG